MVIYHVYLRGIISKIGVKLYFNFNSNKLQKVATRLKRMNRTVTFSRKRRLRPNPVARLTINPVRNGFPNVLFSLGNYISVYTNHNM